MLGASLKEAAEREGSFSDAPNIRPEGLATPSRRSPRLTV